MAKVCRTRKVRVKRNLLDIGAILVGIIAGGITISQSAGFLAVAEDSAFKAPTDPFTSFLAFLLIMFGILYFNRTR